MDVGHVEPERNSADSITFRHPTNLREKLVRTNPFAAQSQLVLFWNSTCRALKGLLQGEALSAERYCVFISYRHIEPDRAWAIWLHGALESFNIPLEVRLAPDRRRIGRVFRDEEELAASAHLSADIKDALNRSDWLVVVCSPRSTESEWVEAEIRHFRELRRDHRILALLIEGDPAKSFPRGLYEIRPSVGQQVMDQDEPLAADVRPNQMNQRTTRKWAKLKLLATILGCRFDDLRRREHEKQLRRRTLFATTVAIVLGVVGFLGMVAEFNRREAVREKKLAVSNESTALTALAFTEAAKHPVNAAKLALAAWPRVAADTTTPKLSATLDALGQIVPIMSERLRLDNVGAVAFSPNGTQLVTTSDNNTALLWSRNSRYPVATLIGHEGRVLSAAFSPDGSRIVTGSSDETARVWDTVSGHAVGILTDNEGPVVSAIFNSDGTRIATATRNGTVRVWDAATQHIVASFDASQRVRRIAFSPDGSRIAAVIQGAIGIWDVASGTNIAMFDRSKNQLKQLSNAFTSNGTQILTITDNVPQLWDIATGKVVEKFQGHKDLVWTAAFSPDRKQVVTASDDKTARIWSTESGKLVATLAGHEGKVTEATFSPDGGRIITVSDDKTARLWDSASGRVISILAGHDKELSSAIFSLDGTSVVTESLDNTARVWDVAIGSAIIIPLGVEGAANSAAFSTVDARVVAISEDNGARIWDASGHVLATLGNEDPINSVAFSPDGTRVVTTSDNIVRIWDPVSGRPGVALEEFKKAALFSVFSPDGTHVFSVFDDGTGRVWDAIYGRFVARLKGHSKRINYAAFSGDGTRIVTASDDKTARVWDAANGQQIAVLGPHKSAVSSASISPDGTLVVTAAYDIVTESGEENARLWDVSGRLLASLPGHDGAVRFACFSPDGSRIVTASSDGKARIWDTASRRVISTLAGHEKGKGLNSATFSPDGNRIVTSSEDTTARVWDVSSAGTLAILAGHAGSVESAAFSPDGTKVVTMSLDKTARVWDISAVAKGNILQIACRLLNGNFSLENVTAYPLKFDRSICANDPPPPD